MTTRWFRSLLVTCLLLLMAPPAVMAAEQQLPADLVEDGQPIDLASARYQGLFKELRLTHGFSQTEIDRTFKGITIRKRVLELMDRQWEAKPYFQYYPRFITPAAVMEGRKKLRTHAKLLDEVERLMGVEREIVVAIWGVETRYGKNEGSFNLFQTLNTMFDAYPRRRTFYRKQLVHFLLLCRNNGVDPLSVNGSYGGAFGQTQFIPSSFREYAVDFDNDGRRDVWQSVPDVLASIANYLRSFGWTFGAPITCDLGDTLKDQRLIDAFNKGRKGALPRQLIAEVQGVKLPPSPDNKPLTIVGLERADGTMRYVAGYPNFQAITAWNHSNRYAMAVSELAAKLK